MIRPILTVLVALLPAFGSRARAGESASASGRWTLSPSGFGPAKIGTTLPGAEKSLGMALSGCGATPFQLGEAKRADGGSVACQSGPETGDVDCYFVSNEDALPGISFMVVDARIVTIDVSSGPYRTTKGAHIGMSEKEIKRLYPRIVVSEHQYLEGGHYLRIESPDHRFALIFETDGKVVVAFRGGWAEPAGYVEGCL